MDEIRQEFSIYKYLLPSIEARIEYLAKRAVKLGMTPPRLEVLREYDQHETHRDQYNRKQSFTAKKADVVLIGEAPQINGWRLRAVIDHSDGMTTLKSVPNMPDLPLEYRQADPTKCEHCHYAIVRKTSYIIENGDGELKQVGSTCLRDFLGHANPAGMLACAEFWSFFDGFTDEGPDDDFFGWETSPYTPAYRFMAYVCFTIRIEGWVSRGKADETGKASTVSSARYFMDHGGLKDRDGRIIDKPTEADYDRGKAAIEWAAAIDTTNCSDYEWNIAQIAQYAVENRVVGNDKLGFLASVANAHMRAMERAEKIQSEAKRHIGTVGKRQDFAGLKAIATYQTYGAYGVTYINKFQDPDGNDLTWFTGSADFSDKVGRTFAGKATIKAHDEYKGQPQTIITRCKFEEV